MFSKIPAYSLRRESKSFLSKTTSFVSVTAKAVDFRLESLKNSSCPKNSLGEIILVVVLEKLFLRSKFISPSTTK